jgi:hypothetical protein
VNFAIGDDADAGRRHIGRYYGFVPEYAELNIAEMLTSVEDARQTDIGQLASAFGIQFGCGQESAAGDGA